MRQFDWRFELKFWVETYIFAKYEYDHALYVCLVADIERFRDAHGDADIYAQPLEHLNALLINWKRRKKNIVVTRASVFVGLGIMIIYMMALGLLCLYKGTCSEPTGEITGWVMGGIGFYLFYALIKVHHWRFASEAYLKVVKNVFQSVEGINRLNDEIKRGGNYALFLRTFGFEQHSFAVGAWGGGMGANDTDYDLFKYKLPTELINRIVLPVSRHMPVYALLNALDSTEAHVQRIYAGDDWQSGFESCAARAALIIILAVGLTPSILYEIEWIESHEAGNRTVIIATADVARKLSSRICYPGSLWTLPNIPRTPDLSLEIELPEGLKSYLEEQCVLQTGGAKGG